MKKGRRVIAFFAMFTLVAGIFNVKEIYAAETEMTISEINLPDIITDEIKNSNNIFSTDAVDGILSEYDILSSITNNQPDPGIAPDAGISDNTNPDITEIELIFPIETNENVVADDIFDEENILPDEMPEALDEIELPEIGMEIIPEEIEEAPAKASDKEPVKKKYMAKYKTKYKEGEYPYGDIYLLAQLIFNEAANQPREGMIAVAEVVLNRVNNPLFPGTVEDVIYSPGQFSNKRAIRKRQPTEAMIDIAENVLNGGLKVFNRDDVLYFRNPRATSGIDPERKVNWGGKQHYQSIGSHAFYLGKVVEFEDDDEEEL